MPRKEKASALTRQKKITIGKFKENNPTLTFHDVAAKYKCSYDQARKACNDYADGKLEIVNSKVKTLKITEITESANADAVLEKQYYKAVAELDAATDITASERIKFLESLFAMRVKLQQLRLESFMKRADAGVIKFIIKKFYPDFSDDDVLRFYLSSVEQWKLQNR